MATWYQPKAVDRLDAVASIDVDRWAYIASGFVWLVVGRVVVLDGVLRLDGVVRVCGDV